VRIGDIEPYPSIPLADHVAWIAALEKRLADLGVRGLDFYRAARSELEQYDVTFVQAPGEVQDGEQAAVVRADGREFESAWVFDSRIRPEDMVRSPRYNYLMQHFTGWEIETDAPAFDPMTVTLFDLRTPQRGGVTFFYLLPLSQHRALVEYTLFSPELLPAEDYEVALRGYLQDDLRLSNYRILESEHGVIPMSDHPFPRRLGRRVMAIGTRGGRVKPSTGYAFARIQRDSVRIVNSLVRNADPFGVPPDSPRHRFHDSVFLDVLAHEPERGREVFTGIFRRNPIQPILRFLDDRSSFFEDLRILTAYPPGPFVQALGRKITSTFPGGKHAA
jgi:lycopene beta-cyclase